MNTYLVTWTIEIEADTAEQAALRARAIHRDPQSFGPIFEVRNIITGTTIEIDTDTMD